MKYPYIHGHYFEPEYRVWSNMHKRVTLPRFQPWYAHVKVCERWQSYENFVQDVGRRPSDQHSLDRIDVAKGYEPDNVRWATRATQSRNTKNHCTNKSGVRGVSWSKSKNKWRASIYVANKQKFVGYFETIDAAAAARKVAEDKYWGDER